MANATNVGISLADVRESVKRMQNEGEKLVVRIQKDARKFVKSTPRPAVPQAIVDLGKQAEKVLRDLEERRAPLVDSLRHRVQALADAVTKTLGVAEAEMVAELAREVTGLTLRIANLERRIDLLAKETKASKKGQAA